MAWYAGGSNVNNVALWRGMQVVLTLAMSVLSPGDLHGFDCCLTLDRAMLPLLLRTLCGWSAEAGDRTVIEELFCMYIRKNSVKMSVSRRKTLR